MEQWIAVVAAWGAAIVAGGFAWWQWLRSSKREAEKELNLQRLKLYPEVQEFMSVVYGKPGGWLGAMEEEGRLWNMMELSNKLILWASNDTLRTWITLVDESQRRKFDATRARLPQLWAELVANMRKDLGYGKGLESEHLFPILFSPDTVDQIRKEISNK